MIRISPAVRLALVSVLLMLSLLFLAKLLKLAPDPEQTQVIARKTMAENLAFQVLLAMSRVDNLLMEKMIENAVSRNPQIESAGIRFATGGYMLTTEGHDERWALRDSDKSTPDFVQIPLFVNSVEKGQLEVSFKPLAVQNRSYLGLSRNIWLLVFLSWSAFAGFWLFLRRTLKHLDPSAVVPGRVRNAMNVLAEGVLILDNQGQIVLANNALVSKLDSDERQLFGCKASTLGWQATTDDSEFPWDASLASGEKLVGARIAFALKDGAKKTFVVNSVPITDGKGGTQGVIVSFDDVSALEAANEQLHLMLQRLSLVQRQVEEKNRELEHLASRDTLTGCYNRRAMREKLDHAFEQARVHNHDFVCIMLDIDHFKKVNDTYGHAAGDAVIKMVAEITTSSVRDGDTVVRFGGEEFCVLLPNITLEQAKKIAERCRSSVEAQECEGIKVTCSFGLSALSLGAIDQNGLVQQADQALYRSKQSGRNRVSLWHSAIAAEINKNSVVAI